LVVKDLLTILVLEDFARTPLPGVTSWLIELIVGGPATLLASLKRKKAAQSAKKKHICLNFSIWKHLISIRLS
jgi:hypothetical protein